MEHLELGDKGIYIKLLPEFIQEIISDISRGIEVSLSDITQEQYTVINSLMEEGFFTIKRNTP